jgi:hypothetical protein
VQSVLLPGGEHFGPLEQPELLTEEIRRFCGSRESATPSVSRSRIAVGTTIRPILDLPAEAES